MTTTLHVRLHRAELTDWASRINAALPEVQRVDTHDAAYLSEVAAQMEAVRSVVGDEHVVDHLLPITWELALRRPVARVGPMATGPVPANTKARLVELADEIHAVMEMTKALAVAS